MGWKCSKSTVVDHCNFVFFQRLKVDGRMWLRKVGEGVGCYRLQSPWLTSNPPNHNPSPTSSTGPRPSSPAPAAPALGDWSGGEDQCGTASSPCLFPCIPSTNNNSTYSTSISIDSIAAIPTPSTTPSPTPSAPHHSTPKSPEQPTSAREQEYLATVASTTQLARALVRSRSYHKAVARWGPEDLAWTEGRQAELDSGILRLVALLDRPELRQVQEVMEEMGARRQVLGAREVGLGMESKRPALEVRESTISTESMEDFEVSAVHKSCYYELMRQLDTFARINRMRRLPRPSTPSPRSCPAPWSSWLP